MKTLPIRMRWLQLSAAMLAVSVIWSTPALPSDKDAKSPGAKKDSTPPAAKVDAAALSRVIGKTDKHGAEVVERPVSVTDLLATVCQLLGIDYTKQNQTSVGRPIRIVEKGANPIKEVLA